MIKAVIFDFDDTLYDCLHNDHKSIDATAEYVANELLRMDRQVVRDAFYKGRETIKAQLSSWDMAAQHNRVLYIQKMLEILGVSPFKYAIDIYDYFWNDFLNRIELFPGALDFLKHLKDLGIKTEICTDMTAHIQFRKLERLGISGYIDYMTTSEEAGVEKPDIRIFNMALNKLGLPPEEVMYIGDSYRKDVLGAKNAGILPVWYLSLADRNSVEAADIIAVENYGKLKEISAEFFTI